MDNNKAYWFFHSNNRVHVIDTFNNDKLHSTLIFNDQGNMIRDIWYRNGIVTDIFEYGNEGTIVAEHRIEQNKIRNTCYEDKYKCITKYYSSDEKLESIITDFRDGHNRYYYQVREYYTNNVLIRTEEWYRENIEEYNRSIN